jgi:hypothetical protein
MKIAKNKTAAIVIAILIFAMAFSLFALPTNAQPGTSLKTYPYVDATPNPVGVGEQTLIRFGILQQLPSVEDGYAGLTISVTKPDTATETLGPYTTDSTGSTVALYTPNQVGTYKLKLNFPEQTWVWGAFFNLEGGNMIFDGTVMLASTSDTIDLVVQQEALPSYPGHALPAEYWTRPVDPQLREWYSVSGNWVARPDNSLALYNDDAPETAHVLWAKQLTTGGLTGGLWGDGQIPASSETGDAYEGKFPNSVVMNGILYYNKDTATVTQNKGIVAVDLHTGKELWHKDNVTLSFGQFLYFNSWNYDGVYNYLWEVSGTTWNAYDPFNGQWIYTMYDVPSGVRSYGPSGEILIWRIDYTNRWLALWNSTAAGQANPNFHGPGSMLGNMGSWANYNGQPLVHGATFNASVPGAYSWNVTIPAGLTAGTSFFAPVLKVYPDRVVSVDFNRTRVRVWGLGTTSSNRGALLFDKSWAAPAEWLAGANTLQYAGASNEVEKGVLGIWNKELRKHYGFSVETGSYLWETDSEHILDAYGWGNAEHTWYFAYGKLYSTGIGGIVYCYNCTTGDTMWTYEMSDAYNEPVTGDNWWGWIMLISDGKVYVGTLEHSAEMPIPRGAPLICLDATTGDVVWRVNGMYRETRWGGNGVIGDSIIATMDTYDQRVYAVGKGPSATTVEAPMTAITAGDSVVIQGAVTDISPGTEDYGLTARFPNGVPAVSDESMSDWMLYVYKQFGHPANATGVPVTLDAVDPNGNWVHIGTVTSDMSGTFGYAWKTPDVPGKYTVIATFAGSKSYYASYTETYMVISEAAPTPSPPQYPVPIDYTMSIIAAAIAVIIVVVIVGLILLLRKRP